MSASPATQPSRRPKNASPIEQVEVDTLMLADWAEAINGKLYIQGGGWDRRAVNPGQPSDFAIAASILIPWNLTNQQHEFAITVESEDGTAIGPPLTGGFTVGRPPNALPGQRFRAPLTARCSLELPGAGAYRVVMSLGRTVAKSVTFYSVEKP